MNDAAVQGACAGSRADAQRDRILCAALKCFIDHGFHAASMANIAVAAQMSAGLIYRYFENKNAIVLAIVQRQLEEKRSLIRQLQSSDQLVDGLVSTFDQWRSTGSGSMSVALMFEMSAEATRNPQIAAALQEVDAVMRAECEQWLRRPRAEGGCGLDETRARSGALQVQLLVGGLALRAAREPRLDLREIRAALDELIRTMIS
jgi:AcrR family transcriptional regulator